MPHPLLTGNILKGKIPSKQPLQRLSSTRCSPVIRIPQTSSFITSWYSSTAFTTVPKTAGKSCIKLEVSFCTPYVQDMADCRSESHMFAPVWVIIRRGKTGRIIVPIFALIMEPKGTPNYVSRAKSAKVLTVDCWRLYPVNYPHNSSALTYFSVLPRAREADYRTKSSSKSRS